MANQQAVNSHLFRVLTVGAQERTLRTFEDAMDMASGGAALRQSSSNNAGTEPVSRGPLFSGRQPEESLSRFNVPPNIAPLQEQHRSTSGPGARPAPLGSTQSTPSAARVGFQLETAAKPQHKLNVLVSKDELREECVAQMPPSPPNLQR